ncbi:MAG: Segregation and condensation protein B [Myxococcota bacterium]|nr:Segregation and condensation protein B [Myxococcota bacterium]
MNGPNENGPDQQAPAAPAQDSPGPAAQDQDKTPRAPDTGGETQSPGEGAPDTAPEAGLTGGEAPELPSAGEEEDEGAPGKTPYDQLTPEQKRRYMSILESMLLVSDKPLRPARVSQILTELASRTVRGLMEDLAERYRMENSGFRIYEVDRGYQLRTDPGNALVLRELLEIKPQRLTRAALECLAIIAYRQPVTRPEIEDIRGVDSGAVVKALLERRLIRVLGKKEDVGRPLMYGTSREFLEFFSLRDLTELPTLQEFLELTRESQKILEEELAPEKEEPEKTIVGDLISPETEALLAQTDIDGESALEELDQAVKDLLSTNKKLVEDLGLDQGEGEAEAPQAAASAPGKPADS